MLIVYRILLSSGLGLTASVVSPEPMHSAGFLNASDAGTSRLVSQDGATRSEWVQFPRSDLLPSSGGIATANFLRRVPDENTQSQGRRTLRSAAQDIFESTDLLDPEKSIGLAPASVLPLLPRSTREPESGVSTVPPLDSLVTPEVSSDGSVSEYTLR